MPFLMYRKTNTSKGTKYTQLHKVPLAGTHSGIICPFVMEANEDDEEYIKWHMTETDMLTRTDVDPDQHAIVIDLAPSRSTVSLYELTDIWGATTPSWTPVALRLEALFVDLEHEDPATFKQEFIDEGLDRRPVYEFLYLQGGTRYGTWVWGPIGMVNGALLWPDTLDYFVSEIRQRDPRES